MSATSPLPKRRSCILESLLLLYLVASLVHFVHNAEFAGDYPNLPGWITRWSVYATWFGITAGGVLGYLLYRRRGSRIGLLILCLYAAIGLDGLLHYSRAPLAAHSHGMNFTIWFEAVSAAVLLVYLLMMPKRPASPTPAS